MLLSLGFFFFFFNDTATTEIYTLSLHDALPISVGEQPGAPRQRPGHAGHQHAPGDRKSTRLNSSHTVISYAVFCLKNKKQRRRRGPARLPARRRRARLGGERRHPLRPRPPAVRLRPVPATTEASPPALHGALPI